MMFHVKHFQLKATVPNEFQEGASLLQWVQAVGIRRYPELQDLFHVPNGGSRHPAEARRLKEIGTKPGVSDYLLLVPRSGYHGWAGELKRRNATLSAVTKEQWGFINRHRERGYHADWYRGWEHMRDGLICYLDGKL